MPTSKLPIIQAIYSAFGRGDVASVVGAFTTQGEIAFNAAVLSAPWQTPVRGHAELPAFFGALATNVEFSAFEPLDLVEGPDAVIARVRMKFRVKTTGRVVEQTQVHWWAFEGEKVRSLVHFEDTAQIAAAVAR